MLDQLVGQVQRLFSSKKNSGKFVYCLTDSIHHYKQILLAISIVLLLGYAQFRAHFLCAPVEKVDNKLLNNFCWSNGTTTINLREDPGRPASAEDSRASEAIGLRLLSLVPHVGINFRPKDGKYEIISHSYVRSLWALLLILSVCSYVPRYYWASIFTNDTIQALLKLPASKDLPLVQRAQEARGYETLMSLSLGARPSAASLEAAPNQADLVPVKRPAPGQRERENLLLESLYDPEAFERFLEKLRGESNEFNRRFDYFVNQLIYLLITTRTSAYKLSQMRLRRKLVLHALLSFLMTCLQFLLPLFAVGREYALYGYHYLCAWLRFSLSQLRAPDSSEPAHTIDYELSARIWPTVVTCTYNQFGYPSEEFVSTSCSVPMNEICGKLFLAIWWIVALNIVIEFCALVPLLLCLSNHTLTERLLGWRCWPRARSEAHQIATFRYRHAQALAGRACGERAKAQKQLEAERGQGSAHHHPLHYGAFLGRLLWFQSGKQKRWEHTDDEQDDQFGADSRGWRAKRDAEGFRESRKDSEIYCLLYLLNRRLECSSRVTECVIRMTARALERYLGAVEAIKGARKPDAPRPNGTCPSGAGLAPREPAGQLQADAPNNVMIEPASLRAGYCVPGQPVRVAMPKPAEGAA